MSESPSRVRRDWVLSPPVRGVLIVVAVAFAAGSAWYLATGEPLKGGCGLALAADAALTVVADRIAAKPGRSQRHPHLFRATQLGVYATTTLALIALSAIAVTELLS